MEIFKWLFGKDNEDVKKIESKESNDFKITEAENQPEALCPYCKNSLIKFPSRKTKCPHCEKSIFVKRLNDSKFKTLITEEHAQKTEIEREKEDLKYKGFHNLEKFSITKDEFIKRKEEHYLKYGIENNNNDVVWSLFNELLIKNANDVDTLRMIYYTMAVLLHQEGKDNFKLLQLSAKATLDCIQLSDLEFKVRIFGCSDSCDACKKLNGKILTMEEAYLLPVPCRECTHSIGFCRCTYSSIPIRDSDGMLIFKK